MTRETDDLNGVLRGADRVDAIAREHLLAEVERGLFGRRVPVRVGRYEILHHLGDGGQGVVYAAHDPRLDRRVAVKLLRVGTAGADAHRWLLREAAALARLSHPNVVGVNDVGQCDAGVFVVTELVPGVTLGQWLAAGRPWAVVLRAFLDAAEGLAAAHARGIVHRDFKPANVLVGDDGRVRLLDFGLARSTEPTEPHSGSSPVEHAISGRLGPSGSLQALTRTGHAMGTPAYMAPEQHAGAPADEAADQFAFCVALYEGLWGRRPFHAASVEALADAKRCSRIPTPARGRGAPRALFAVVARGLAADPRDRWPSMRALSIALTHAAAHPHRRRRIGMGGALALAIAIGAVPLSRAEPSRPEARDRDDPEVAGPVGAVDPTERVLAALAEGLRLRTSGAYDEAGRTLEAAYLDADASGLDALALQAARELAALHGAYRGDAPTGREWMRHAEAALDRLGAAADPADPGLLELASSEIASRAGEHEAALVQARHALEILDAELPVDDPRRVHARTHLARTLMYTSRLDEAQAEGERALAAAIGVCGPDHVDTASAFNVLALVAKRRGELAVALELQRRNLTIREAASGTSDPIVAGVLANIAVLQSELGRAAEAEATYRRALAIQKAVLGSEDAAVARTLHNLAITVKDRGRVDEALELWHEALSIGARTLGPDHSEVAAYEFMYAFTLTIAGRAAEALPLYRHALEVDRAALGDAHPILAERLAGLSQAQLATGDLEGARHSIDEAVAIVMAAHGLDHPLTARVRVGLAKVLAEEGRIAESLAVHEHSLAVLESALGSEHTAIAEILVAIAVQQQFLGRAREAREAKARADAIFAAAHGKEIERGG